MRPIDHWRCQERSVVDQGGHSHSLWICISWYCQLWYFWGPIVVMRVPESGRNTHQAPVRWQPKWLWLRYISNDPNFHLKHPGVLDSSDGSDGTSYALTANYTLCVAQAIGRVAYIPPLLGGDIYASSERHVCYTLRRGCSYAVAVFQESFRP